MATTHTADMPASHQFSAALRHWPLITLALASASGALYCTAQYALATSLTGSQVIVSDPEALAHWRRMAALYGVGLAACLILFVGSCVALRRRRLAALVSVCDTAI
jgi:hypothetical protein